MLKTFEEYKKARHDASSVKIGEEQLKNYGKRVVDDGSIVSLTNINNEVLGIVPAWLVKFFSDQGVIGKNEHGVWSVVPSPVGICYKKNGKEKSRFYGTKEEIEDHFVDDPTAKIFYMPFDFINFMKWEDRLNLEAK